MDDAKDTLAALTAASDQLAAMSSIVAQPVAAFYLDLRARGCSDEAAATLAAILLHRLLGQTNGGDE